MQNTPRAPKIRSRKQGNSTTLTIPASFGIPIDKTYHVELLSDGTIVYHPTQPKNIFDTDFDFAKAMHEMGINDNGNLVGKENVW